MLGSKNTNVQHYNMTGNQNYQMSSKIKQSTIIEVKDEALKSHQIKMYNPDETFESHQDMP